MSDKPTTELNQLEAALRSLQPATVELQRDQLMYQAGHRAAQRGRWRWPACAGVLAVLVLVLGLGHLRHVEPQVVVKIVHVPIEVPVEPEPTPPVEPRGIVQEPVANPPNVPEPLARGSYLRLRDQVVRWGPEVLPGLSGGDASGPTSRLVDLLNPSSDALGFPTPRSQP